MATITTIRFQDVGQQVLEFDIDDKGIVIDARPHLAWFWNGARITNFDRLKVGGKVGYAGLTKIDQPCERTLRWPVQSVTRRER